VIGIETRLGHPLGQRLFALGVIPIALHHRHRAHL
jgi:hypothetical protein